MNGYDLRRSLSTIFDLLRELRERTNRIYLNEYGTTISGNLIVNGDISSLVLDLYDKLKKTYSVLSVENGKLLLDGKDITATVDLNDDEILEDGVKEDLPPTTGAVLRTLNARTAKTFEEDSDKWLTSQVLSSIISSTIDSSTPNSNIPTIEAVKGLIETIILDGNIANIRTMKVEPIEGEDETYIDSQGNLYMVDSSNWTASVKIYPNANTIDDHTSEDPQNGELRVLFGNNVYIPEFIIKNSDSTQRWKVVTVDELNISSNLTYHLDWIKEINDIKITNNCSNSSLYASACTDISQISQSSGISINEIKLNSLRNIGSLKSISGTINNLYLACSTSLTDLGNENLTIENLYFIQSELGTVPNINSSLTQEIEQDKSPSITNIYIPYMANSTLRNGDYYLTRYMEWFNKYISKVTPTYENINLF